MGDDAAAIARWSSANEGQFFERKSIFDRSGAAPKRRPATEVAWDVAETLAAMANADGGELVVGIEDDGRVTGITYPDDKLLLIREAPNSRNYVDPPLNATSTLAWSANGDVVLCFSVEWSPEVHRLANGRYVLRINDASTPFPAEHIAALKSTKGQGLVERSLPLRATIDDIDLDLVETCLDIVRYPKSPEDMLHHYRLVERRDNRLVPRMAGLLLFGKDPGSWHPRCGIDIVRWEGKDRKHGVDFNITKRIRIDVPVATLIDQSYTAIQPYIRERQRLHDLFFTERLEYPTFAWQEAIVNAVSHRDYSILGASIEVWMFDDHIEIRSPGLPPSPVTIESLNLRKHVHLSRNPLIIRVLADLGYVRELGEGIPRMFAVMESEGFYPPKLDVVGGTAFRVQLFNEPIYDHETLTWLQQFQTLGLTGDQKRLLAFGRAHGGRFTSRDFQKLSEIDIYGASNAIKELIRKGAARSTGKGSRVYEVVEHLGAVAEMPADLVLLLPLLRQLGEVGNVEIREALGVSRAAALRRATDLLRSGWLERSGQGRWTRYRLAASAMQHPQYASSKSIGDA